MIKKGIYRHYKGGLYEVLGVAVHSETLEELVLYKSLYDTEKYPKGTVWARPKEMFLDYVDEDGVKLRFEFVSD